ncbi:MAG TPA: ABC transporter permease [Gemmatimonadaceae bacterium]|nr:ABC transporter permease [Gemmatimonadaceae bacterium]
MPRKSLLERCYRLAMLIYPHSFRARFGDEMLDFARRRREHTRSTNGVSAFAAARESLALLTDLVRAAPAQWIFAAAERRTAKKLEASFAAEHASAYTDPRDDMDILLQDLRFAARGLVRRPAFTIVAALTLALGIGANTAIFSVVNGVLIRPLPYPNGDRVVTIWGVQGTQGQNGVVYADYVEWRAQNRTFDDMGAYRGQSVNLTGGDTPDRVFGMFVSASFMRLIGATPVQGRTLTDQETEIGTKAPVAVLTYEAWQTRFGSDPAILGKTLVLNGQPHTVVGVTRPNVQTPFGAPDVFIPMPYYPNASGLQRGTRGVSALGTLKPGVTIQNAERDLKVLAKRQEDAFPTTNKGFGVELQTLKDQVVGSARAPIYLVFAAVGMVLLIACANVANLQLARGAARHRELSVRAALGAARGRIAQQLLTESILLSMVGGVAGLAIAALGTKWLATVLTSQLALTQTIRVDGPALLFAFTASVLSGVLFGVAPAWKASRTNVQDMLGNRSAIGGQSHAATRNTLVVVQLALSLALLCCAGLLTRSLIELQRVNIGIDSKNLMTAQFRLPAVKYDTPDKIWAMFDRAVTEIRAVPGVQSAALVRAFPFSGNGESYPIAIEGRPPVKKGDAPNMQLNTITPQYFATMGIPRLNGRDIAISDTKDAVPVIVVNDEFAKKTWPSESAIGKRVQLVSDERWWTIVGVVGNSKHFALNEHQLLQGYIPHAQRPQIFTTLAVRTAGDPLLLARSIREAIWRVDRDQPVWGIRSMDQLLDAAVGSPRLIVRLTVGFAVVALLLGGIGIYGVLSYTMSQRTKEVGIRIALGAESGQVVRMVVGEGLRIIGIAVVIGLAGSFAATRLLRSQLFGVGPTDVLTFAVVTVLLSAVAMLACYLPARRASRVDPMVALRAE